MALFQRPDRAKRDFLKALKSGQLDTEALRKGLVAHEFDVDDVLWCLYESNKKVQQFGLFALGRSTQDDKTARLIEALRSEAQPARRTVVAQARQRRDGSWLVKDRVKPTGGVPRLLTDDEVNRLPGLSRALGRSQKVHGHLTVKLLLTNRQVITAALAVAPEASSGGQLACIARSRAPVLTCR